MRITRYVLLVLTGWFFLHCLWLTQVGLQSYTGKADVAVVLGNTVFADGTLSPWLKGRVDKALELYRNGQVKKIFVSGGIGEDGLGYPEGDAMRNYLVQQGVAANAIIVDNEGINTYFTALHLAGLHKKGEVHSAVVVTSFYHVGRTRWIAAKLFGEDVPGASSTFFAWADWYGIFREFFAYYKYRLVY